MTMAIDRLNAFERRSEARLALSGFRHLYETQLKSERKSPKTIEGALDSPAHEQPRGVRLQWGAAPHQRRQADAEPGGGPLPGLQGGGAALPELASLKRRRELDGAGPRRLRLPGRDQGPAQ